LNPEINSIEGDRRRFWVRLAVTGVVLLLLAVAGWLARTPYRHFKERRSAALAQSFLARGDYPNAVLSARQAISLNPNNVAACRVMAGLADLTHSPAALDWQRRIVQTDPSTENKLQLAAIALRYQSPPFPLTAQILRELAPLTTNLAAYHVVAASWAVGMQRLDDAESHFETAARLEPTNQLFALNLAILRLESTNATKAVPARAVLDNLRTDATLGPPALRALVADRLAHKDVAAANVYSSQLLACAKATLADQLQQLGIVQQLNGGDFGARLQAVQQQAATNALAVAEVAAWMVANNLAAGEIAWLTNLPPRLQTEFPVRVALADAYLQSADWRALRDFTANGSWEEMDFLRLALLSRAWARLGMADDSLADDLRGVMDFLQTPPRVRQASSSRPAAANILEADRDFVMPPLVTATNDLASNDAPLKLNNMRSHSQNRELVQRDLDARAGSQLSAAQIVAHSSWSSAVREAGSRHSALTTLLKLTERWELPREREDLLERIAEKFPQERWAMQALEPLYLAAGNTAGLNRLYARSFALFPQDAGTKNNLAFTCLLLKTNLPQACQWAAENYAGNTNNPVAASTYAFALHLEGRNQDGLAVMQKLDAHELQQPDTALYYAVLLAATGATNEAAPFVKIARTKTQWLPEEKVLLATAAGER
jgi:hypothetical protein